MIRPTKMSINAASFKEFKIKNPIVISSKERDNIIVPACNRVLLPTLCKIQIAVTAPTTT